MNESLVKTALVDLLAVVLGDGTTPRLLADDIRVPTPGCGFDETKHRKALRKLIGATPDAIEVFLDSLVGVAGSSGTLTRTNVDSGPVYSVVE